MKYVCSIVLFITASLVFGQSEEIEEIKSNIDKTYFVKPHEARNHLIELLQHKAELHDTVVAASYGKLGTCYIKTGSYAEAESTLKKGLEISGTYSKIQANLYILLAITYRYQAFYERSLEALEASLCLYDMEKDTLGIAIVYGEMASNFNYMLKNEASITYLKKALELLKDSHKPEKTVITQKLANAYYNNGNYEYARDLYKDVLAEFSKVKSNNYYYTLINYADCLLYFKEYAEAEGVLIEAAEGLLALENYEFTFLAKSKLGKLYRDTGQTAKATVHYKESYEGLKKENSSRLTQVAAEYLEILAENKKHAEGLEIIDFISNNEQRIIKLNAQDELNYLKHSITVFKQNNMFEKAFFASERRYSIFDSLQNSANAVKVKELQEAYQNELQREKNIVLESHNTLLMQNNKKQKNIILLSAGVFLLFILLVVITLRNYRVKEKFHRLQLSFVENEKKALIKQRQLENEILQEQEKLLSNKEREVTAIAFEMVGLQNRIQELIENQKANEKVSSEVFQKKLNQIFKEKNYWETFKKKFIEVHPNFYKNLRESYPQLTSNDVTFCSLVKLKLSNKEIASFLAISHATVISKKYRLKKKINMDDQVDLDHVIRQL